MRPARTAVTSDANQADVEVVLQNRENWPQGQAAATPSQAVTDPNAAMVELALLREQWEELEQIHARAGSYLNTLDSMLLAPVST